MSVSGISRSCSAGSVNLLDHEELGVDGVRVMSKVTSNIVLVSAD